MFEDFFNVVKKRFNDNGDDDEKPMFKCPRCQTNVSLERYEEFTGFAQTAIIMAGFPLQNALK